MIIGSNDESQEPRQEKPTCEFWPLKLEHGLFPRPHFGKCSDYPKMRWDILMKREPFLQKQRARHVGGMRNISEPLTGHSAGPVTGTAARCLVTLCIKRWHRPDCIKDTPSWQYDVCSLTKGYVVNIMGCPDLLNGLGSSRVLSSVLLSYWSFNSV